MDRLEIKNELLNNLDDFKHIEAKKIEDIDSRLELIAKMDNFCDYTNE